MVLSLLLKPRWVGVWTVGALAAGAAFAQAPIVAPLASPSASAAPTSVSALPNATAASSAFDGYKPYTDEPVGNWKAVNDTVGKIGGWREYAKQSQPSGTPPAPAPVGNAADPAAKSGTSSTSSTSSASSAQPNPKAKP